MCLSYVLPRPLHVWQSCAGQTCNTFGPSHHEKQALHTQRGQYLHEAAAQCDLRVIVDTRFDVIEHLPRPSAHYRQTHYLLDNSLFLRCSRRISETSRLAIDCRQGFFERGILLQGISLLYSHRSAALSGPVSTSLKWPLYVLVVRNTSCACCYDVRISTACT